MKKQTLYISIFILLASIIAGCGGNKYEDTILGMTVQSLDKELKNHWSTNGVVIIDIKPGSPAEQAGLKIGELISYVIGERRVQNKDECKDAVEDALEEDRTAVIKFADGREVQIFVRKEGDKPEWKLDGTKVAKVKPEGPAEMAGIKIGDQIVSVIDEKRIKNLEDYEDAIDAFKDYTNKVTIRTSELINIKLASLRSLGQLGDPLAIGPLVSAMQREDVAFRVAAAESLDQMVSMTKFNNIFEQFKESNANELALDKLVQMSGMDRNQLINDIQSAERLGLLSLDSTNNTVELVAPLGLQFKNRFQKLSQAVYSERVLELVRRHFKRENEPDQEVRRYCASILAKLESEKTINDLVQVLKDSSEILDIRFNAGLALSNIGKPSIPFLISALGHEDTTVKSIAATSLGEIGGEKARIALIDALDDTKESTVKLTIARALAKIGDQESIRVLEEQKKLAQKDTGFEMFISELLNDIKKKQSS